MPKPPREIPRDEFTRRRLAKQIARAVTWLHRRAVTRAVQTRQGLAPYQPSWIAPWWRRRRRPRAVGNLEAHRHRTEYVMSPPRSDPPFTTPGLVVPARQPQPGERLWVLHQRTGTGRIHAELRDDGRAGAELQLFRDDVFFYGRRHPSRAIALAEAEGCRLEYEAQGWQPVAEP